MKLWTTRYLPVKASLTGRSGKVSKSLPKSYFPGLRHVKNYPMFVTAKKITTVMGGSE